LCLAFRAYQYRYSNPEMGSGVGGWAPSAFICSVVDCNKTGKFSISKVVARCHCNVHHREKLGVVGNTLVGGVEVCAFCDQTFADGIELHLRESNQVQYKAAWDGVLPRIGPFQKRQGKTTAREQSALPVPPAGLKSTPTSRVTEVGGVGKSVKEAAVGGPVEEARRLARYLALSARMRELVPEVDCPAGFERHFWRTRSGTAWLRSAGMAVDDARAACAVVLCALRSEDTAQNLLGQAVIRYIEEAGQLAAGRHGLPTAVTNNIQRNGLLRKQGYDHCGCVSYLERFHSSSRTSLYLLSC
jgi:hypothetical protein